MHISPQRAPSAPNAPNAPVAPTRARAAPLPATSASTSRIDANPFAALLRLHDVSKELQKSYRDSALHSQQMIYDTTLRGIAKARAAQANAFILQMVGAAVQIGAGLVMLKMSTAPLKEIFRRGKSAPAALKELGTAGAAGAAATGAGAEAGAGAANTTGVIAAKITPPAKFSHLTHSRVTAVNALAQGLSGVFAQTGSYVARLGELEQQGEQAKAARESQMLELRNSQMQEQGANAREIRDAIRTIIPNRSFHA
ncbi:MAG: hypothetical protein ACRYHA_34640 [Janthinobacterium lividum]